MTTPHNSRLPYRHLELCGIALIKTEKAPRHFRRKGKENDAVLFGLFGTDPAYRTLCSGTAESMGRGEPSTHWIAFLGHLETQVPQPLHLV